MNRTEAANTYEDMLATWPAARGRHEEPTVRVWVNYLAELDYETAQQAVYDLAMAERFFPSVAAFNEAVHGVELRRTSPYRPALPAPKLTGEERAEAKRRVLALRDALREGRVVQLPAREA